MMLLYLVFAIGRVVLLEEIKQHTKGHDSDVLDSVDTANEALGELERVSMVGYSMGYQVRDGVTLGVPSVGSSDKCE